MKAKIWSIMILVGLLIMITGCTFQSGEDFYALPKLPEDYVELQVAITEVVEGLEAEYSPPTSGDNTQNIQLHDLDRDGEEETAVTFLYVAGDEKPLKIYFFRQSQNGNEETYEPAWIIEGEAASIYSIDFVDLSGNGLLQPVVIWQISAGIRSIGAYELVEENNDVVEMMYSGMTQSAVLDMDQDNQQEILLVQANEAERTGHVEMYKYSDGLMVLTSQANLSDNLIEVKAVKKGNLSDQSPAVFITSEIGENGGYVTDVVAFQRDEIVNLTIDPETHVSSSTLRYYTDFQDVYGTDFTNNGVLDLPIPEELPLMTEGTRQMYILHWYEVEPDGQMGLVGTTFHCYDDGWYIEFPQEWEGHVTAARQENSSNSSTERAVTFYYMPSSRMVDAEPFLSIYRLSGTNRNYRASVAGRFTLLSESEVIYAARIWETDSNWNSELDQENLISNFALIQTDWSTE